MDQTRILLEAELPPGTDPEIAREAAALLQEAIAGQPDLAEPEVSLGAERASAGIALIIDALVSYAPHLVAAAAGATTIFKAIEAAKALIAARPRDKGLSPAQRLIAELPLERIMLELEDGTRVPLTQLVRT
ncbi:hypothetical protein [Rhodovulum strictum]|uniref:Uncharacterized protein n=1 Tax=Rhodovulum strictum TaxID=58314 RepID=A0A844BI39_9RHOB|nr:hypothetical protein [Rhodovulum strictum]MRH20722.1 hypothetical protein [Rhodovulum strictum]